MSRRWQWQTYRDIENDVLRERLKTAKDAAAEVTNILLVKRGRLLKADREKIVELLRSI